MTFFTRIRLNRSRRGTMSLVRTDSAERLKAVIYSGFPGEHGRILYRLDRIYEGYELYVVSPSKPDFTGIQEEYGWPQAPYADQISTTGYDGALASLKNGDTHGFRISVNPTWQDRDAHRRHTVRGANACEQWFSSRADSRGFHVIEAMQTGSERITAGHGQGHVTLDSVTLDGTLKVTDADALRRCLTEGFGRGKGYGLGLMTLR